MPGSINATLKKERKKKLSPLPSHAELKRKRCLAQSVIAHGAAGPISIERSSFPLLLLNLARERRTPCQWQRCLSGPHLHVRATTPEDGGWRYEWESTREVLHFAIKELDTLQLSFVSLAFQFSLFLVARLFSQLNPPMVVPSETD